MEIGRLGVWTWLDSMSAAEAADFAGRLETWGYSALWVPEAVGRDPFSFLGYLAARTERLVLATGIANIYARDAMTTRAVRETLAEASNGRFVLGLGVLEGALYMGREPGEKAPVVIAALRPRMLALAAEKTRGAHPYFVPPEHTARAREILGSGPWLCPEQMVLRETDATRAREIARENMKVYVGLPNYQNNLRWLGYSDDDFADGGSDRLVDAIVAWGDEKAIAERIRAHHDAGADHVCIQPLRPDGQPGPDLELLETLAPSKR
jgi:probable F420-dependent oxidoreductase